MSFLPTSTSPNIGQTGNLNGLVANSETFVNLSASALWRWAAVMGKHAAMRIVLASDHAGFELKDELAAWLRDAGHDVSDLGTNGPDSVDYPAFGRRLANVVASGQAERGIAVCGSGIGISIAINREPMCRCARVDDPLSAALAREHNDANVIALGARLIGPDLAKACVSAFLDTDFAGGRHQRRVDQLSAQLQDSD